MELLFISDVSQLAYVQEHCPELLRSSTPVVEDVVVAYELERLGVAFVDEWSFLTPAEIEANSAEAHQLATRWWDESRASTEYRGIRLSSLVQQDLIYPLEACLNARTVYQKLFDALDVTQISGFFLPPTAVVRTGPLPASRAVRSVAQAVLLHMAEVRSIPVQRRETGRALTSGRIAYKAAASVHRAAAIQHAVAGQPILIYEDGMYPEELTALCRILGDLPDARVVTVSQRVLGLAQELQPVPPGLSAVLDGFWRACEARTENYAGEFPEIFANRHLLFQLRSVCDEMRSAAMLAEAFAVFLDTLAPSIVVFGHEAFARERALVATARQRGIPSLALMHGIVRPRFTYQGIVGDADSILVSNQTDVDGLTAHGVAPERIHAVGCVRFAMDALSIDLPADLDAERQEAKRRLGLKPERAVVVWTTAAINASFASPVACPAQHRASIQQMAELMKRRSDLQFVIKAHPSYDYYGIYKSLIGMCLPNLSFPEHVTLNEVLAASDVCLLINYCTTAVVDALLQRIPVIYLEQALYPLDSRKDNLALSGLRRVADVVALEKSLDVALARSPGAQQDSHDYEAELRNYFGIDPPAVSKALFAVVARAMFREIPKRMMDANLDRAWVHAYLAGLDGRPAGRSEASARIRSTLLCAYVLGRLGRTANSASRWYSVQTLTLLAVRPRQLLAWPSDLRRYVVRQLVKQTLGGAATTFPYHWMQFSRKASAKFQKAPKGS